MHRAYIARNLMAHNRSLGNNVYDAAAAATNEMLEWLGFDAVKAQRRIVVLMGDFTRSVKS